MKITPTTLTITQLMSSPPEQFVIPAYQRRYSWQGKQVDEFFQDIIDLEQIDMHLLGSMVCLTGSHQVGVNQLELVDGQQRLTTIILFMNAIQRRLYELGNEKEAEKLDSFLFCQGIDRQPQPKLVLGELDLPDFKLITSQGDLTEMVNVRLRDAFVRISKLLSDLSDTELDSFRYKLENLTNVIRLDVSDAKDAFKLFETINNRGLSLSPTDIIKNFLLGTASLIDAETLDYVKQSWSAIIRSLDHQPMDDFFRQYMMGVLGRKISSNNLTDEFKVYYSYQSRPSSDQDFSPVNTRNFVKKLQISAELYSQILNASTADEQVNRHLRNLKKIRSQATYTFVLRLMQQVTNQKVIREVLWILEVFMLRRNIAQYRTSELDDFFSALAVADLTDEKQVVPIVLNKLLPHLPSDMEFEAKINQNDFRGQYQDRAKYMLEQIEEHRTGKTGEKQISGGGSVHLEHIMPQTINTKKSKKELGDWEEYLGEAVGEHYAMVAKLGNMTLLSANLNIKISNNPFAAKQEEYKNSIIELTKELAGFKQFKMAEIQKRTAQLAKEAVGIWRI